MTELNIRILGGKGVGKTSLLVALLPQLLEPTKQSTGSVFYFKPESDNLESGLANAQNSLREMFSEFEIGGENNISDKYVDQCRMSLLRIGEPESESTLVLDVATAKLDERNVLDELEKADVVFVTIDTPALMEKPSELSLLHDDYHASVNNPAKLRELVSELVRSSDDERLFVFVPVKCEKYLERHGKFTTDAVATNALLQTVRSAYSDVFAEFNHKTANLKTAIAIVPVQTVGGFVFSRIERNGEFRYAKRKYESRYEPAGADELRRILLLFAFRRFAANDNRFVHAMDLLEQKSSLAEIVRGHHLLGNTPASPRSRGRRELWLVTSFATLLSSIFAVILFEFGNRFFDAFLMPVEIPAEAQDVPGINELIGDQLLIEPIWLIMGTLVLGLMTASILVFLRKYWKQFARSAYIVVSLIIYTALALSVFFLPAPLDTFKIQIGLLIITFTTGLCTVGVTGTLIFD